jgi:hypothetical protein
MFAIDSKLLMNNVKYILTVLLLCSIIIANYRSKYNRTEKTVTNATHME